MAVLPSEPGSAVAQGSADPMPYTGIAEDCTDRAISARGTRNCALGLDELQDDARQSEPTSAMLSIGGFQLGSTFGAKGSEPSVALGTPLSPPPASAVHSTSWVKSSPTSAILPFSTTETSGVALDAITIGANRLRIKIRTGLGRFQSAALPLVLLGLAAVGIMARRYREFPLTA
jgi:hypothetical protein